MTRKPKQKAKNQKSKKPAAKVLRSKQTSARLSRGSALTDSPEYIPEAMEDSLARELGEATVASATTGDQADEAIRDEDVPEEVGGPFVTTTAREEFALGPDASNPIDAEPAPFPTVNRRRGR
jgi:hypothetical protein